MSRLVAVITFFGSVQDQDSENTKKVFSDFSMSSANQKVMNATVMEGVDPIVFDKNEFE